jgi:Lon protease-like protein
VNNVRIIDDVVCVSCLVSSDEDISDGTITYDRLLPTAHSYMNVTSFQEFSGVRLLSDDRRCLLHIVELANMILIPNQIVPWQVFNIRTTRMIKEAKQEQRLFGVIDACSSLLTDEPKYGTTAEIVSYHEESNDNSLQLKIIGRQRFIIDDSSTMKRDLNGILRAHVRILPEIYLRRPPLPIISQNDIHRINFVLQHDLYLQREKYFNRKYVDNEVEHEVNTDCEQIVTSSTKRRRTTSSSSCKTQTSRKNIHALSSLR